MSEPRRFLCSSGHRIEAETRPETCPEDRYPHGPGNPCRGSVSDEIVDADLLEAERRDVREGCATVLSIAAEIARSCVVEPGESPDMLDAKRVRWALSLKDAADGARAQERERVKERQRERQRARHPAALRGDGS